MAKILAGVLSFMILSLLAGCSRAPELSAGEQALRDCRSLVEASNEAARAARGPVADQQRSLELVAECVGARLTRGGR